MKASSQSLPKNYIPTGVNRVNILNFLKISYIQFISFICFFFSKIYYSCPILKAVKCTIFDSHASINYSLCNTFIVQKCNVLVNRDFCFFFFKGYDLIRLIEKKEENEKINIGVIMRISIIMDFLYYI